LTRIRRDLVGVVFVGGCLGGWARYAVVSAWHAPDRAFPSATLTVNLVGALVLGLLVVFVSTARPGRYLRPLVGTGFCGALTTFSSVVVATDQLFAHHRAVTAVAYLGASIAGGLAAAAIGVAFGRLVWTDHATRAERSS
jgi:CrcB protein